MVPGTADRLSSMFLRAGAGEIAELGDSFWVVFRSVAPQMDSPSHYRSPYREKLPIHHIVTINDQNHTLHGNEPSLPEGGQRFLESSYG
jgi:hypothetical protein